MPLNRGLVIILNDGRSAAVILEEHESYIMAAELLLRRFNATRSDVKHIITTEAETMLTMKHYGPNTLDDMGPAPSRN